VLEVFREGQQELYQERKNKADKCAYDTILKLLPQLLLMRLILNISQGFSVRILVRSMADDNDIQFRLDVGGKVPASKLIKNEIY
jgi:hypothetical protein